MSKESADSSEFVIAAPDLQIGLSAEIERGTRPKEFLNRYHAEYDVRCAFCAGHTPHRRGFTVRLEDGRTALCGIDCAREFFGEEVVSRFAWDLQRQIDHQSQLRVLARTVDGAPEALTILNDDWIEIENAYAAAVGGINVWIDRADIKKDLSGDMLILKRYKNVWVDTVARDGRDIRRKETIEEIQARIQGGGCLLLEGRPFGLAKGGLASLAARAQRPDTIKGKVIDELMQKRRSVIGLIKDGLSFSRSAHAFFQEQNLGNFLIWYRRRYSGGDPEIRIHDDRRLVIAHPETQGLPTVTYLPRALPDPQRLLELLTARGGDLDMNERGRWHGK